MFSNYEKEDRIQAAMLYFGMWLEENNVKLPQKGIDHCHSTNKIRGVLCNNCNTALGLVGDNIGTLQSMVEYLSKNTH
jgi:hypothetical protein